MAIVLVTGAASGIGRACALELSKAGFTIAANYRSKKGDAQSLLQELEGEGHRLFQADITKPEESQKLIAYVVETYGELNALVMLYRHTNGLPSHSWRKFRQYQSTKPIESCWKTF